MEFTVKLAKLPDGFLIPARLSERMAFDEARGRLAYRGFMTKCAYDELSSFSDDPEYHRALEELFVLTSGEMSPRTSARKVPVAILGASIAAAVIGLAVLWGANRNAGAKPAAGPSPNATASTAR